MRLLLGVARRAMLLLLERGGPGVDLVARMHPLILRSGQWVVGVAKGCLAAERMLSLEVLTRDQRRGLIGA